MKNECSIERAKNIHPPPPPLQPAPMLKRTALKRPSPSLDRGLHKKICAEKIRSPGGTPPITAVMQRKGFGSPLATVTVPNPPCRTSPLAQPKRCNGHNCNCSLQTSKLIECPSHPTSQLRPVAQTNHSPIQRVSTTPDVRNTKEYRMVSSFFSSSDTISRVREHFLISKCNSECTWLVAKYYYHSTAG